MRGYSGVGEVHHVHHSEAVKVKMPNNLHIEVPIAHLEHAGNASSSTRGMNG